MSYFAPSYTPFAWFWIVGGDESRAWSSAAMAYVTDWPPERTTRIASEDELWSVLIAAGVMKTRVYKTDIWRRATDAEAEMIDAALNSAPLRLRRIWNDAPYINTQAPEFPMLRAPMVQAFGEARADELLAPTE